MLARSAGRQAIATALRNTTASRSADNTHRILPIAPKSLRGPMMMNTTRSPSSATFNNNNDNINSTLNNNNNMINNINSTINNNNNMINNMINNNSNSSSGNISVNICDVSVPAVGSWRDLGVFLWTCAVPKSKISPSRRGIRRHGKRVMKGRLSDGQVVKCSNCGGMKLAANACGNCGFHHGRFFYEALSAKGRKSLRDGTADGIEEVL